jgi:hypothetical protein
VAGEKTPGEARGFSPDRTPIKIFKAYISAIATNGNILCPTLFWERNLSGALRVAAGLAKASPPMNAYRGFYRAYDVLNLFEGHPAGAVDCRGVPAEGVAEKPPKAGWSGRTLLGLKSSRPFLAYCGFTGATTC